MITGLHCNNGGGGPLSSVRPPEAESLLRRVGGQADRVAFRVGDRGKHPVRAVGGGRHDDVTALSFNQAQGLVHVPNREPDHGTGIPGRRSALDPLADEPRRGEVRVVLAGLPAEDRLVEGRRPVPVGGGELQVADLPVGEGHELASLHSTTKRPEGWVRAAATSRPAWRASPVNCASGLVLPPATSMSMPRVRGAASGVTPPRMAMLVPAWAASEQRRRMATVGSSGQSLRTLLSRYRSAPAGSGSKKLWPASVTRSATSATISPARATVPGRSTRMPLAAGCRRSSAASRAPVPPPTSTTVRTASQPPVSSTS